MIRKDQLSTDKIIARYGRIIDYFDENNELVKRRQKEVQGTKEFWGGPEELFRNVKQEKFPYMFGRKESKDQAYFVVHLS